MTSDDKTFVTGATDCLIKIWDVTQKICIHTIRNAHIGKMNHLYLKSGPILCIVIIKGDQFFISGSEDRTMKIWSFAQKGCIFTFDRVHSCKYSFLIFMQWGLPLLFYQTTVSISLQDHKINQLRSGILQALNVSRL